MKNLFSVFLLGSLLFPIAAGSPQVRESFPTIVASENCEASVPELLITWFPAEITCPVCKTKNTFLQVGSYGSYIYQYPSKYQLIFWPFTDSPSWYSCKQCGYTAFMGSFEKPPLDKLAELTKVLKTIDLPAQKIVPGKDVKESPPYLQLPVSARLLAIEKIQRATANNDDEYWSHFYRVLAYHLSAEGKGTEADGARRKALSIIETMLSRKDDGKRKELLYVAAAMHHFLSEDEQAQKLFNDARVLSYNDDKLTAGQNKNYDDYLSTLITEYVELLNKGQRPRLMKNSDH